MPRHTLSDLRRELRAPVRARISDDNLRRLAFDCSIRLCCVGPDRWEAMPVLITYTVAQTADGRIDRDHTRTEYTPLALASDRTARGVLRRLLESSPDAVRRAATAPTTTVPITV